MLWINKLKKCSVKIVILKSLTARLWHSLMVIKDPSNKNHKALPRIIFPFVGKEILFFFFGSKFKSQKKNYFQFTESKNFLFCFDDIVHIQHKLTRKLFFFVEFQPKLCYHQQTTKIISETNCKQQKLPVRSLFFFYSFFLSNSK